MAGTSAVFLSTDYEGASPVERDGMVWSAKELHLSQLTEVRNPKPPMQTVLALEGLEEYDMPVNGDVRKVDSLNASFVYFELTHAWIQII
ncbi:MAG: hypothetical protein GKR91_06395 [Pseudomonadales bacterium]|nr:hypothetical protein [Pseudomonadales bacterium]